MGLGTEKLNSSKPFIAILELLLALVLATLLLPTGFVYSLIYPFKHWKSYKGKVRKYYGNLLYQVYFVVMRLFHYLAYVIDLLGNVLIGELIEEIVTTERETLFGKAKHSISQAFGYILFNNIANNNGREIAKYIDMLFGKDHCLNAYLNVK